MSLATQNIQLKGLIVGFICVGTVLLLAVPAYKWAGWGILVTTGLYLWTQQQQRFARHMLILVSCLFLLGLTPINTDVSPRHMLAMGSVLAVVVALPYLIMSRIYHEKVIAFPWNVNLRWGRKEMGYLALASVLSYLLLPYYLYQTGSYMNWDVGMSLGQLVRLFIGTNALGIWDELFFVGVCLALLRQHLPFMWANIAQAVLWTAFLYELGFRGWGPLVVFGLALSQGYIFKVSKSLSYIIAVHLTVDLVLFLALVHLHNPQYVRIFITSPL